MSNSSNNSSSGGIGFVGLLTIVFIVLRLIHETNWSWWWVLSPLWISAGLTLLIIAAVLAGVALFGSRGSRSAARRYR